MGLEGIVAVSSCVEWFLYNKEPRVTDIVNYVLDPVCDKINYVNSGNLTPLTLNNALLWATLGVCSVLFVNDLFKKY